MKFNNQIADQGHITLESEDSEHRGAPPSVKAQLKGFSHIKIGGGSSHPSLHLPQWAITVCSRTGWLLFLWNIRKQLLLVSTGPEWEIATVLWVLAAEVTVPWHFNGHQEGVLKRAWGEWRWWQSKMLPSFQEHNSITIESLKIPHILTWILTEQTLQVKGKKRPYRRK